MTINHGGNLFAICRERGWDWRDVLDLSASINPLGFPAGVRAAIDNSLDTLVHYPAQQAGALESDLAARWHVPAELVIAGAGATELLHFIGHVGWHGPAALVTPVWSEFHRVFPHALRLSIDEPQRWPQRGLLVIGRPVNPTGVDVPLELVRRTLATREGPVLVDESFIDFAGLESAAEWCTEYPNLIVLRSFSKFYALPGMRVGALACSPDWAAKLRRRRGPWMIGSLAEAAARAALADTDYAERTRALIDTEREWLLDQLDELDGLRIEPSVTNYLFASLERSAREVCDAFLERRILIRNCTGIEGVTGEAIRFAIRTREENERFVEAAREIFRAE